MKYKAYSLYIKAVYVFAVFLFAGSVVLPAHAATTGPGVPIDVDTGQALPPFPIIDNGAVNAVVWDGTGGWYVGGSFTSVAGNSAFKYLVHITASGTLDTAWTPSPNGVVYTLLLSGTTLYVGGEFNLLGGQNHPHLGAVSTTNPGDGTFFFPNPNANVRTLALVGSTLYAGGEFTSVNPVVNGSNQGMVVRNGLAAFRTSNSSVNTDWNPNPTTASGAPGKVYAVLASGSKLYVGGVFANIGGHARNNMAAIDIAVGSSGIADSCNPNVGGTNPRVLAIQKQNNILYLGGSFSSIRGNNRNGIAAVDSTAIAECSLTPWNPNPPLGTTVNALKLKGAGVTIMAGGNFTSIGGQTRNRMAELNTATNTVTAFNPSFDNTVLALAFNGEQSIIYVGGLFASVGVAPDTTAPDTTITSTPSNPSTSSTATFSFASTEANSTFLCSLDGGTATPCSSPVSYIALSDGPHSFRVRAVDAAKNIDPTPAEFNWSVDTTAPDTVIASSPPSATNATTAIFTFESSEPSSTFACKLDSGSFTPCVSPLMYTNLAEGAHTFAVTATDSLGHQDPTSATFAWTIDTTSPDTFIDTTPSAISTSSTPTFTFHATEPSSTFFCKIDTEAEVACTSPHGFSNVSDGSHTFSVYAVDALGNSDSTPATYAWVIDATAPNGTVVINDDALVTGSTAVTLTLTCTDAVSGCAFMQVSTDGVADTEVFEAIASTKGVTLPSGDGERTVQVVFKDAAGNLSTTVSDVILLDTTAPDTIIDSGPDSITNSTTALFTFHSPEAGSTFECKLDSGNFAPCSGTVEFSSLGDGSHTFAVRAIDAVGNVDQTPATHAWTIDSTAPVISNVTVVPSLANGTVRITITKTVTDATSVASVSATIKGPHPATSVVGFVNLSLQSGLYSATFDFPSQALAPDGVYTIEDTATDSLGNSITLDDGTITLDRTGASVTIVSIIPQVTQSANHVVVTVVAQDETSGFADQNAVTALDETINVPASFVSFSGSLAPGQIGTWVFNQPAGGPVVEGTHNEKVTAVDAAGNISHVTGTYVVDNTAPDTVIDSTPVTSANTPNATFTFHSTELNSSFLCQLDGGAFDACVSPKSYTALTDGQHSFVVKATDEAGNTDPTPASFIWSVDSTVPTGTVLINNGDAATKNTQVTLTLTCEDAGTGCAEMQISLDGMLDTETFEPFTTAKQVTLPPTDGNKTVLVLFKDTVGNVSSEASDTIILDTTAPDTVVDTAPASGATNTSATFTFHATEPTSTFMCKLDSGAFAACVSGVTFSGLSVGTHTFAVFATDAVGNEDASPADYIWNIKPVITDSDGDGVQDAVDQCINVQGPADRNGCPVADKINFTMNIVDQEKTGVCGYDQNGKPKENCTTPLQGAIVRIFDRDSAAFVSAYSSKRPAKDMSGIIFENGHGLVGQCTTDSTGTCLVGEDHAGKFMVIAKFVDGSTSIYTAIFKNFQRKVVSATQNSEDDDDIDDVQARALVIEKNMSITKKVKKNGQVEYSGSRVVTN